MEIRDGSLGRPGDGMAICVGAEPDVPQIILQLDNDSTNSGDNNDDNHVVFACSRDGFPCTDATPPHVFVPIDPEIFRLNEREPPPAPPNRFCVRLTVVRGIAFCEIDAIDRGIDLGQVFRYEIPDFEPFSGDIAISASTEAGTRGTSFTRSSSRLSKTSASTLPSRSSAISEAPSYRRTRPSRGAGI